MSATPRISYSTHEGQKPEEELSALASIYALAMQRARENRFASPGDQDLTEQGAGKIAQAMKGIKSTPESPATLKVGTGVRPRGLVS